MTKTKTINQRLPQRTCVACREVKPKREFIRLAATAGGNVEIDLEGKSPGRGAYLCRRLECWETGLAGSRLGYTLRTTVTAENRERLMKQGRELLGGANGEKNR